MRAVLGAIAGFEDFHLNRGPSSFSAVLVGDKGAVCAAESSVDIQLDAATDQARRHT
jgi:hypothetical protein